MTRRDILKALAAVLLAPLASFRRAKAVDPLSHGWAQVTEIFAAGPNRGHAYVEPVEAVAVGDTACWRPIGEGFLASAPPHLTYPRHIGAVCMYTADADGKPRLWLDYDC